MYIHIHIHLCVCVCVYTHTFSLRVRFAPYKMPNNLHPYSRGVISDYLPVMSPHGHVDDIHHSVSPLLSSSQNTSYL